ncbi:MAG: cobalamin-dependent protein [Anaerolineales bacterium]|nr:cobalamin-dependent protein [Anaerolineales bacterium]
MMLEGAGFEVQDLGSDVDSQKFVQAAQDGANIIGMSALLTTTMSYMQTTIQALQTAGLRDTVKVVIGGAPVTDAYAKQVGADAFAPDASSAVRIIKQLVA